MVKHRITVLAARGFVLSFYAGITHTSHSWETFKGLARLLQQSQSCSINLVFVLQIDGLCVDLALYLIKTARSRPVSLKRYYFLNKYFNENIWASHIHETFDSFSAFLSKYGILKMQSIFLPVNVRTVQYNTTLSFNTHSTTINDFVAYSNSVAITVVQILRYCIGSSHLKLFAYTDIIVVILSNY